MRTNTRTAFYHLTGREEPIDATKLRRDLIEFYDRFERLIDVICAGARYGTQPSLAADYHTLSEDMRRLYPELRTYVLAYLKVDVRDTQFGIGLSGQTTDAFQCLFCAPSLAELIAADDGGLVGRIERTRDALYRFGDHLREVVE
jgi:hypothetical protein